jgi:RNA polymerase primary sigma factor
MSKSKIQQSFTNRDSESFNKYLKDVSNKPLISREEEIELVRRVKGGCELSKTKLIESNLRFVISIAKQFQGRGLDVEDLVSEGNLGLVKACDKFDGERGMKFITYAVWWIRQSIFESLSNNGREVRLPQNQIDNLRKIETAKNNLEQHLQRKPTNYEISEYLNFDLDKLDAITSVSKKSIRLDAPVSDSDDNFSLLDTIQSDDEFDNKLKLEDLKMLVADKLKKLNKIEKFVIVNSFGLGCSEMCLSEIADRLNLSSERIRQIKKAALAKLV